MEALCPTKHVQRCYGMKRIDRIAAIGRSGGGLSKTFGEWGVSYLQAGELDRLRADGVEEVIEEEIDGEKAPAQLMLFL